jgi:hypothetical protein
MIVYVLSFVVLLVIMTGMAVGVIFSTKPIKGSCGGMSALGMETECDVCGGDKQRCEKEQEKNKKKTALSDQFYDASKREHS